MASKTVGKTDGPGPEASYRVVVLELLDVVPRICQGLPNVYVGVTSRTSQELATGLKAGRYKPSWARNNVVKPRDELAKLDPLEFEQAKQVRDQIIKELRMQGYTVNRKAKAYRTYVVNLHNKNLKDPGKGYVYVGETSLTPEERLQAHLLGKRNAKGRKLFSSKVLKYGADLNYDLMNDQFYLTREESRAAEKLLAEKLRTEGYVVEGGH